MKKMKKLFWSIKSVQSIPPAKSLPGRQAGVFETNYNIVNAHDGEIKVETKEEKGSRFVTLLPLEKR
jgi:signal transduction histidine kinase